MLNFVKNLWLKSHFERRHPGYCRAYRFGGRAPGKPRWKCTYQGRETIQLDPFMLQGFSKADAPQPHLVKSGDVRSHKQVNVKARVLEAHGHV